MKFFLRLLTLVAVMAGIGFADIQPAQAAESHVVVVNTTDKWVWVTAYQAECRLAPPPAPPYVVCGQGRKDGAWCVAPGSTNHHGHNVQLAVVRAEVTSKNCAHPLYLDRELSFPWQRGPIVTETYLVSSQNGTYSFRQQ